MPGIEDVILGKDVEYFFKTPFLIRVNAMESGKLSHDFSELYSFLSMDFLKRILEENCDIISPDKFEKWVHSLSAYIHLVGGWNFFQVKHNQHRLLLIPYFEPLKYKEHFITNRSLNLALLIYFIMKSKKFLEERERAVLYPLGDTAFEHFETAEYLQFTFSLISRLESETRIELIGKIKEKTPDIVHQYLTPDGIRKRRESEKDKNRDKVIAETILDVLQELINDQGEKITLVFIKLPLFSWQHFLTGDVKKPMKTVPIIRRKFSRTPNLSIIELDGLYEALVQKKKKFRKEWDTTKRKILFRFIKAKSTLIASFVATRFNEAFRSIEEAKQFTEKATESKNQRKIKKNSASAVKSAANALNSLLILLYSLEMEEIPPGKWSVARPATLGSFKNKVSSFFSDHPDLDKALNHLIDARNKCEHPEALDDAMTIPVDQVDSLRAIKNVEQFYEILRQRVVDEKFLEGPYEDLVRTVL